MEFDTLLKLSIGQPVGQLRAAPVSLAAAAPHAFVAVYGADYDVDPSYGMFFFPSDTLKLLVFDEFGAVLWKKDLGRGVVPGMWFCPVLPFDLDGDGADEIWLVNNSDPSHPLRIDHYVLERLDVSTGESTGQWKWPVMPGIQSLSHLFRNFIFGGQVKGKPVLVTAQGTYGEMFLQAYNGDMSSRWQTAIPSDAPGARGAHMHPVCDINGDGIDEVMWGERCISMDTGEELFCCDRDVYRGHSDIVQPVWDESSRRWYIYTFRENDPEAKPRVVLFSDTGARVWGAVDHGHIDMGWVARLGEDREHIATALRIGTKKSGAVGHSHEGIEEFGFQALTGRPFRLPFATYRTLPVDLDGDGRHELVTGLYRGNGVVYDWRGNIIGNTGCGHKLSMASKLLDAPGEQICITSPDGILRILGARGAEDSAEARTRYANPFYKSNQKLSASGYHINILGGV